MKKVEINNYLSQIGYLINEGSYCQVYLLKDGRVLKLFNNGYLTILKNMGSDIEKMLLESENYEISSNIKKPLEFLYNNGIFCGYIMERAKGITLNERYKISSMSDRANLHKYAIIHSNLEKIIRESKDIVFPDLLTCDNIFIDNDKNIELIDFDGMQVGNNKIFFFSSSLGDEDEVFRNRKYCDPSSKLFTKELDAKSLIYLYFIDVFNIRLNTVGKFNPYIMREVTLDDIFSYLQLDDVDVMQKVWNLYERKRKNEYLGEDVFRIAEKYDLSVSKVKNGFIKKLVRK